MPNELQSSTKVLKIPPAGAVTGPAIWAAARLRVAQWNQRARNPKGVQVRTLLSHCHTARDTEFGRAHGLGEVRSHADFRERVPLRPYADFEPYLVRMRKGERDVLWPGLIPYYGMSSGTSNTAALNKYLPISKTQIAWQQRAGFDVLARYVTLTNDRSFTGGYTLNLLPPGLVKNDGPVGVSSNPGIMQRHMPVVSRMMILPRQPLRDIEDYDKKLTRIAEAYLDHDVRALSGTTCWFSVLFDRVLAAARARGRDVNTVAEVWPNLRAMFGGGVHAEPYRPIIDARVGHPTALIDNYNATEGGIFAITDRLGDDGLLMVPDRGVFYEFVPRSEMNAPAPRRFALWEVEPGVDYSVVLTTSSGLFGYVIGDFVRFTSVFPHRMVFAGRASGVLSVTQELTTSLEIERSMAGALGSQACSVVEFAAAAEVGVAGTAKGRYLFFVEFERDPGDLAAFGRALDGALSAQNRVYREHRAKEVAILPPVVVPLARGATRKFMEAIGQQNVQQKFPRILDSGRRDLLRTFARDTSHAE